MIVWQMCVRCFELKAILHPQKLPESCHISEKTYHEDTTRLLSEILFLVAVLQNCGKDQIGPTKVTKVVPSVVQYQKG